VKSNKAISSAIVGLVLLCFFGGCKSESAPIMPTPLTAIPRTFSDVDWAKVLSAVVTPDGYVQWNIVQSDEAGVRAPLLAYIGLINAVSPVNHPDLFASPNDRVAYWINAYNAMCVFAVVEHDYPATMQAGQPPGWHLRWLGMLPAARCLAWVAGRSPTVASRPRVALPCRPRAAAARRCPTMPWRRLAAGLALGATRTG